VSTTFKCTEGSGGAGLSSCDDSVGTATEVGGTSHLDTSTAGTFTYTVTAVSKDGLTSTASISYTVTSPSVTIRTARISVFHGKGRLTLVCSGAVTCSGKLVLKLRSRIVVVATYEAPAGRKNIIIHLSKNGIKLLTKAHHHRLGGQLQASVSGGQTVSRTVRVSLRP
jgi:hypothetical protein